MEFRLLGPMEVIGDDGASIPLGGARPRALLAQLLLNANDVVSTDRLIDGIWGEQPPASAASALQVHVHALRRAIGPDRIVTRPPGYVVRVDADELDVDRFARLVADGDPHGALALWRGQALADLAFEPFAQAEAARLEEARLAALEARIDADLDAGRHGALTGELDALAAAHPHRERLQAQRMPRPLPGGPPGRRARRLPRGSRRARRARPRAVRRAAGARAPDPRAGSLARRRHRAKTRFRSAPRRRSSAAGSSWPRSWPSSADRTCVCSPSPAPAGAARPASPSPPRPSTTAPSSSTSPRSPTRSSSSLPSRPRSASAMSRAASWRRCATRSQRGRRSSSSTTSSTCPRRSRRSPGCSSRARNCRSSRRAASRSDSRSSTSTACRRSACRRSASRRPPTQTPTPSGSTSSGRGRNCPDFELTDANANAVARICRALDGLPLAIELAAARVRVLGPEGTAKRLGERLSLLTRSAPDLPERQRSLRATIDWSYRLLDDPAAHVFRAFSVFAGGATLDAVEAVGGRGNGRADGAGGAPRRGPRHPRGARGRAPLRDARDDPRVRGGAARRSRRGVGGPRSPPRPLRRVRRGGGAPLPPGRHDRAPRRHRHRAGQPPRGARRGRGRRRSRAATAPGHVAPLLPERPRAGSRESNDGRRRPRPSRRCLTGPAGPDPDLGGDPRGARRRRRARARVLRRGAGAAPRGGRRARGGPGGRERVDRAQPPRQRSRSGGARRARARRLPCGRRGRRRKPGDRESRPPLRARGRLRDGSGLPRRGARAPGARRLPGGARDSRSPCSAISPSARAT